MDEHIVRWEFRRYGDNRSVVVDFSLHRDAPWSEILPFFLDFLKGNGYVFAANHELEDMCTYDHAIE